MDVPLVPLVGEYAMQIFFRKGLAPAQISGSSSRDVAKMLRDRQIMLPGVMTVVTFPVLVNGVFKSAVILFHRHNVTRHLVAGDVARCIAYAEFHRRLMTCFTSGLNLFLAALRDVGKEHKHHMAQIRAERIVFKDVIMVMG